MRSLAVLTTLFAAAVLGAQDATKELERLNGTWMATSVESAGVKLPADTINDIRLTFTDGAFTARDGKQEQKGTLKIDPSKKPMTMDIIHETGDYKGKTQLAIYDLQGGVLKVCVGDIAKERPSDFETKSKPGVTLLLLKKGQ